MFMLHQSDKSLGNLKSVFRTVKLRAVFERGAYRASNNNYRKIQHNLQSGHNTDRKYVKFQRHFQTHT